MCVLNISMPIVTTTFKVYVDTPLERLGVVKTNDSIW